MRLSPRYVLPVFLLIVFAGPIVLGPILNLGLAPLGIPFHRVMSRALLISALGALVLFRGRLKLGEWWPRNLITPRQIAFGLLLAVVSSIFMIGLYHATCGFHAANLSPERAALGVLTAALACVIVPILEETIFRGFLITILMQSLGRRTAWLLGALIFALAHFLRVPPDLDSHRWWSGAQAVAAIFTHLGQGEFFSGRGLNLFLAGLILGGIFLRSGSLWTGAALHGGWILILMTFTAFTRADSPPRLANFGGDLLSSPLTSAVLLILGLWLWRFYRPVLTHEASKGSAREFTN
jgi:membrane protease YdiL (CAAX protease family)